MQNNRVCYGCKWWGFGVVVQNETAVSGDKIVDAWWGSMLYFLEYFWYPVYLMKIILV